MASDAFARLSNSIGVANRLLMADDGENQLRGRTDFYHASWAAFVASWDSYIKSVCEEYLTKANVSLSLGMNNTGVIAYQALHQISMDLFQHRLNKFNTPNIDNSREFIVECTGYDPYADWRWDKKALTNIRVKELLNEAVRVRHAFAHGFPVRNITQLSAVDGTNRVSYRKAVFVRALISHLCVITDRNLDARLKALFGREF